MLCNFKSIRYFFHFLLLSIILIVCITDTKGQSILVNEQFIQQNTGEYLQLPLSKLPDLSPYLENEDVINIRIDFQIGEECEKGATYFTVQSIEKLTNVFVTDYKLSLRDNGKYVKLKAFYVIPTDGKTAVFIWNNIKCNILKVRSK